MVNECCALLCTYELSFRSCLLSVHFTVISMHMHDMEESHLRFMQTLTESLKKRSCVQFKTLLRKQIDIGEDKQLIGSVDGTFK